MKTKSVPLPKQQMLKMDFTYNAATGEFTRLDGKSGWVDSKGYKRITYRESTCLVHRLVWKWWYGYDPEEIDHINGNKSDNRIDNLRSVSCSTNNRNRPMQCNNTSGFTGVAWYKSIGRWSARVKVNRKTVHIGVYDTPQEANAARDEFLNKALVGVFSLRHGA